jgi:hypothetical protein
MHKEVPEDIQRLLKEVVDVYEKEDRSIRERQIRQWRQLKLFWEGIQRTWYSEVAHDWRIWDEAQDAQSTDQSYYDKPVNIFRAYLESIIAALSVTVPPVKAYPDDADNVLDLMTAKGGDKIAQLVYRHNDAPLFWLHGLFIFMTEGMVACYGYPKASEAYGTYEKETYNNYDEQHEYTICPKCGFEIDDQILEQAVKPYRDEFQPDDSDVPIQDLIESLDAKEDVCPSCMAMVIPELQQRTLVVERLVGITQEPKSRVCLEAYGGLYVKVANYAKKQADTPYLIFSYETNVAMAVENYEHLQGKNKDILKLKESAGGQEQPYDQWARLSPQYRGQYPENVVTVRNAWLRPGAFNCLSEKADIDKLKKEFPNGAKVVHINDTFAEAVNESLDDCWTLTNNPLADYITHDPLGLLLVSIQEIINDLISLIMQTIEHGISQTFADPGVVNFNAYRQMETIPGGMYEATPKTGKSVADAFHELKTATLSGEVLPFANMLQTLAQLVSGALPSLFGGQIEGSETASEYSMSRAQALQRLQNIWKIFTTWWKQIFGKVIPMYIKEMKDDEKDVQRTTDGGFINVFIRRAELEGKIGKIELEANENLPMTWSQQRDIIMQLLQAGNPEILKIIGAPENLPVIRQAIGLTDFYVPNEDDREKQLDEIRLLLNSEPIPTGDPMIPELPSVEVDQLYDNHAIEFEIVRKWVVSEEGRQAKANNELGYKNVLLHGRMHYMFMQQMQQLAAPTDTGAEGGEEPYDESAPIEEESDVQTVV